MFSNAFRTTRILLGAAVLTLGVGCAAQQSSVPASAQVGGAQALAAGTQVNTGQSTYIMPALPAEASYSGYALTGDGNASWQPQSGHWVNGVNGQVFVPAAP